MRTGRGGAAAAIDQKHTRAKSAKEKSALRAGLVRADHKMAQPFSDADLAV